MEAQILKLCGNHRSISWTCTVREAVFLSEDLESACMRVVEDGGERCCGGKGRKDGRGIGTRWVGCLGGRIRIRGTERV